MLIPLIVDFSRRTLKDFIKKFIQEIDASCKRKPSYILTGFTGVSLPISSLPLTLDEVLHLIEITPYVGGLADPYYGVRAVLDLMKGTINSSILILWSMGKKPRTPFLYPYMLAKSAGADKIIIASQRPYPPRWADSYFSGFDMSDDVIIFYRAGKQKAREASKYLCL